MKKLLLTALIGFSISTSGWSAWVHNWSRSSGSTSLDQGKCIANALPNTVVSAGIFNGTVDFDPGAGTANLVSSGQDMYLLQYGTLGTYIWAKLITGTGIEVPTNIITQPSNGMTYVCGYFTGTMTIDPAGVAPALVSAGGRDAFLACYNSAGAYVWAIGIGGAADDEAWGLSVDGAGGIALSGCFSGALVNFNPLGLATTLSSAGGKDAFFGRYNATTGVLAAAGSVWQIGGTTDDCAFGIHNGLYVTGYYTGAVTIGSTPLVSAGGQDIFVAKFSNTGVNAWAKSAGGPLDDWATDIVQYGNFAYITGGAGVGADWFGAFSMLVAGSGTDPFIAAYDVVTGTENWLAQIRGSADDLGQNIASDNGYLYVSGYHRSASLAFQHASGALGASIGNAGGSDFFLTRYNTAGIYKDVKGFGSAGDEDCPGLSATPGSHLAYVTGSFTNTVDFGTSTVVNRVSAGVEDIFIATYRWSTPLRLAHEDATAVNAYPNPASSTLYIDNLTEGTVAEVYALDGKKVGSWIATGDRLAIELGEMENGIYLLRLMDAEGKFTTEKIVVQH